MPLHDATRDLILLNQQRLTDVEVNLQLEANNEQLEQLAAELENETEKSDSILKEMLPPTIAKQLMLGEHIEAGEKSTPSREILNYSLQVNMKKQQCCLRISRHFNNLYPCVSQRSWYSC